MIILVDAMGGDNAPDEIVKGCIEAVDELNGYDIMLVGDSERITKVLKDMKYKGSRIKITHTKDVITNDDTPVKAIKSKKDSSMVVGFNLLKQKKGDIFVSAGNTGALMSGGLLILGRIKGVDRPALTTILPTKGGKVLLIDAGANTTCKPLNFLQFGIMGSIYMKEVAQIANPRVGLINVGIEEKKGNELVKQAHAMLASSNINFIGNIEGRDVLEGKADVAVCDGFVGNILLKFLEGLVAFIFGGIKEAFKKNIITSIAALILKKGLKNFTKQLDYHEVGGVPLLGVNGKMIKCHGSSNAKAIKNSVKKAYLFAKSSVLEQIEEEFKNMEVDDIE